jgi:hypothetical protein
MSGAKSEAALVCLDKSRPRGYPPTRPFTIREEAPPELSSSRVPVPQSPSRPHRNRDPRSGGKPCLLPRREHVLPKLVYEPALGIFHQIVEFDCESAKSGPGAGYFQIGTVCE